MIDMIFLMQVKFFLKNFLLMPSRLAKLEAGAKRAEALYYFDFLNHHWPEAAEYFQPSLKLAGLDPADLANIHLLRSPSAAALAECRSETILHLAETLVSLPFLARCALFEEATRIPFKKLPAVLANYIFFLSRFGFDDAPLLAAGERFTSLGREVWQPGLEEAWGLYLAALVRAGRLEEAEEILSDFVRHYRLETLAKVPPAALWARSRGRTSPALKIAATLYELIKRKEEEGGMEYFFRGKSVAVVGNSPLEKGRGRGREIDGHDLVLRFNMVWPGEGHWMDYGSRTSVMAKNYAPPDIFAYPGSLPAILLPEGLERYPVPVASQKIFLKLARQGRLLVLPLAAWRTMVAKADFVDFSTGLMTVAWLKAMPDLSSLNLYGFSHFLDDETKHYGGFKQYHYVAPRREMAGHPLFHTHPLDKEREYMRSLFRNSDQPLK